MPWPFCTTSTVIASGTTSSSIAGQESAGTYRFGRARPQACAPDGSKRPSAATSAAPTISAPISGGMIRPSRGHALRPTNVAAIGAAIQKSSRTA